MQHDTTKTTPDGLLTASAMADKANADHRVTDLFAIPDEKRALAPVGTQSLDARTDLFKRDEKQVILDAAGVRRMGQKGLLTEHPQGNPEAPFAVLYDYDDLLAAVGLEPTRKATTADDGDQDDEPERPVSPSGAAIQLNIPEKTVMDLLQAGQIENQTMKDSTAPDINQYRRPTVLLSEVRAVLDRIDPNDRPDDLVSPRQAAWEVGQGLKPQDVRDAIDRAEVNDYAEQAEMQGKGPDGKVTTEYASAGGPKVSIAAVREWHAARQ